MRILWLTLSLVVLSWWGSCPTIAAERPNVLFILTDDQGAWASGYAKHPDAKTPHLDRLFRESAYFPHFFTPTPVCSPSRASILVSRYGSEVGITDWINPNTEPKHGLDTQYVTWPEVLAQAGYRTGLIGKWHLGTQDHFHPSKSGYQFFLGFRGGGNTPQNPLLEINGQVQKREGFLIDIVTDEAIAFLREKSDKPWLLSLHHREPHTAYVPTPPEDSAPFAHIDPAVPNPDFPKLDIAKVKKQTRDYLSSIHSIDRNVGRLLAELDRLQLAEKTIVIFTSDHGYNIGHHGVWHKGNGHWILTEVPPGTRNIGKNQRPNMFDTSLRVPACVRWKGVISPETFVSQTCTHLDWYPTILALCGVQLPPHETIRGRSFAPLLRGQSIPWDNNYYGEYSTHHTTQTHMRVYRTPEWKLKRDFKNPDRDELYDLKNDPDETRNLVQSSDRAILQVKAQLHAKIVETMRQLKDPALPLVK